MKREKMNYTLIVLTKKSNIFSYVGKTLDVETFFKFDVGNSKFVRRTVRALYYFLHIFHLQKLILGKWYKYRESNKIVFMDIVSINDYIVKFVKKHKNSSLIYLWNIYKPIKRYKILLKIKENVFSFDKNDCEIYGFNYFHGFYPNIKFHNERLEFDLFFCGQDKGRKELIYKICKSVDNSKNKILIIDNIKKNINYSEYINLLIKSKCIIEIRQKGQTGDTLRTLESIVFSKKIITNNIKIVKEPYYKVENIFVIEDPENINIAKLNDFMKSEYVGIQSSDIESFYPENWIKSIFELNDNNLDNTIK